MASVNAETASTKMLIGEAERITILLQESGTVSDHVDLLNKSQNAIDLYNRTKKLEFAFLAFKCVLELWIAISLMSIDSSNASLAAVGVITLGLADGIKTVSDFFDNNGKLGVARERIKQATIELQDVRSELRGRIPRV
ncbi:MAG TPA: hypothetical protein VLH19_01055 [Patescibacteria group bacterium]|nr:hypothetical protein [Patescibacteria group bacterium]